MFALNAKMPLKIESATHFQGIEFSDAGGDGDCGYRALAVAYAEPNHFPYLKYNDHFKQFFAPDPRSTEALKEVLCRPHLVNGYCSANQMD